MRDANPVLHLLARAARRAAAVCGTMLLSGCFSYLPLRPESLAPAMPVRVHLTPESAARVAPALGGPRAYLDGVVVGNGAGLLVRVPTGRVQGGTRSESLHQEVLLQPSEVAMVQQRRLDRGRTFALVAGGGALAAMVLIRSLSGESGSSTDGPGGGGPPEALIPGAGGARR